MLSTEPTLKQRGEAQFSPIMQTGSQYTADASELRPANLYIVAWWLYSRAFAAIKNLQSKIVLSRFVHRESAKGTASMTIPLRIFALACFFVGLASVPLFASVPNPYNSILLTHLHNCSHSFLSFAFHLLSLLVARQLAIRYAPTPPSITLCIVVVSGFSFLVGLAIEVIQPYVGRIASWGDVGRNSLGIVAANGAFLSVAPDIRSRAIRVAAAVIAITTLIYSLLPAAPWAYAQFLRDRAFPVLADYENPYLNKYTFAAAGAKVSMVRAPAEWPGNEGHVAKVEFPQGLRYPGMILRNPSLDWRNYSTLVFEAYLSGVTPAVIGVNIYSSEKGRRPFIHHQFVIEPGLGTYQLKLPTGSSLAQHNITGAIWHALRSDHSATVYFDNIRLK